VSVCIAAYIAGVVVLAAASPVVYTAAVTIGSWVPVRHHVTIDSQSAFSDAVPATSVKEAMESFHAEADSDPLRSLVIHIFHMLTFTNNVMSSTTIPVYHESTISNYSFPAYHDSTSLSSSLPACHESTISNSSCLVYHKLATSNSGCARNRSERNRSFGGDETHSSDQNFTTPPKNICGRQWSKVKGTGNGPSRRPMPPNQHTIFSHQLSSREKPAPASERTIPHGIASPLSDTHNASLLISVGTLLDMV